MASEFVSRLPEPTSEQDQIIRSRLTKMAWQVKLTDLIGSLMLLIIALLAFFVLVAIVDHWILPLGSVGRFAAFTAMLAGLGYFVAAVGFRFFWKRINPAYAAHTIERSQPALKNSLVNYLLFRSQPSAVHAGVFEALRQRAAGDLSHVDIDAVVDRSKTIFIGYALAAVFALAAIYSVLSPKSTLQTVQRVVAPWQNISRPARVQISDVAPGNTTVFVGSTVSVSAAIEGLRETETVSLYYSTADGQVIDNRVQLVSDSRTFRYQGVLPVGSDGVRQELQYRIEAGDAVAGPFTIGVQAEPAIVVEQLEYEYPAYTQRPNAIAARQADVQALEGTRVTIVARANYPIQSARIEFDPDTSGERTSAAARRSLAMTVDGTNARGVFTLTLDESRRRAEHATYQIRFTTVDGDANPFPTLHQIEVVPDLPPEIETLTPETIKVEVPEDGRQPIEIRAVDPDFGLTRVTLRAVAGSEELFDEELFADQKGRLGQSISKFDFEPRRYNLQSGSRVSWWAVAEDNRTSPDSGLADPNTVRTPTYEIVITPSRRGAANGGGSKSPSTDKPNDSSKDESAADSESEQDDQGKGDQTSDDTTSDEGSDASSGESDSSATGESETGGAEEGDSKGPNDGKSPQAGKSDQQSGEVSDSDTGESGNQQGGGSGPEGGSKSKSPQNGGGEGSAADDTDGSGSSDASGGTAGASKPADSSSDNNNATRDNGGGGTPTGQPQSGNGSGDSPNDPSQPLHDGEVFEKIEQYRREQQQKAAQNGASGRPAGDASEGSEAGNNREAGNNSPSPSPADDPGAKGANANNAPGQNSQANNPAGSRNSQSPRPNETPANRNGNDGAGQDAGNQTPNAAERQADQEHGDGRAERTNAGDGGKPRGPRETESSQQSPKAGEETPATKPGMGDNGEAGAGQRADQNTGSPSSRGKNKDRPKSQQPDNGRNQPDNEGQPSSDSKNQSDSTGGQSGDRSGGGKQGGGQGANQAGNDSAGSNSSADEGAGASSESGDGETGNQAGDQQVADDQTGNAGSQAGAGSTARQGSGDQPDNQPANQPSDANPAQPNANPNSQSSPTPPQPNAAGRQPGGGGLPMGGGSGTNNSNASPGSNLPTEVPDGEKANLDYARKATDLTLDFLEQQQEQPDRELLDELGWTPDDLRKFVQRWRRMKDEAETDAANRQELDESLRSLGLRPPTARVRGGDDRGDTIRNVSQSGDRSAPPSKYRDLFNAFKKGTARSQ